MAVPKSMIIRERKGPFHKANLFSYFSIVAIMLLLSILPFISHLLKIMAKARKTILVMLVGLVEAFGETYIISGVISFGMIILLAPVMMMTVTFLRSDGNWMVL
jgi:hypothetical protein